MKIFRATGNREFEIAESDNFDPSHIKLKISALTVSAADVGIYQGRVNRVYPIVPCHMATAVVSEDYPEYGLKRGARVILNPYVSPAACGGAGEIKVYGMDKDGFLRDFIAMPIDNVIPFPEDVKENDALFTEYTAVALAAINTFEVNKGDYIAVVGGSVLSILIAQLALYYQAIPIFIAGDKRYLDIAEKCGIYYAVDESREDPYQRVMDITGGRMAEHTVLHSKTGVSPHFLFSLAGRNGDAVIVSINATLPRMETDISLISKKNLTVKGVSSGVEEINAAVNIIAQKQLNFSYFIDKTVNLADAKGLFDDLSDNVLRYVCPVIKVN
jgi:Threonine dehydrogenase and related Zn-dependent dehydrogenases